LFDFIYPFASSGSADSDLELGNESPQHSPEVLPDPSDWHEALGLGLLRPPREDNRDADDESSSFPHPHILSTIPEEDDDEGGDSSYCEGEDDTSSIETVRFASTSARARPDTGLVWASDGVEHLCESSACAGPDRRMSV